METHARRKEHASKAINKPRDRYCPGGRENPGDKGIARGNPYPQGASTRGARAPRTHRPITTEIPRRYNPN